MMSKVSIIVPVYRVEKYIEKCVRSIFEQSYPNLEIIIVDDCTPDKSVQIIKDVLQEYPLRKSQVSILSQSKNKGVASARKRALDSITGDYCIQFDSDDYVEPRMIEEMLELANKNNADIVVCDINLIYNNITTHIHVNPNLDSEECMKQILRGELHSSLCNKLIRVGLYRDNQIQFVEGLNMREDLSVMFRLLFFARKIAYVAKPFYSYVLREGSLSSDTMNEMQQKNAEDLIEQMDEFCIREKINDKDLLDAFVQFKAKIYVSIILFGNIYRIKRYLFKGIKLCHYWYHPRLPLYQKVIGMISLLNVKLFIVIIRFLFDKVKKNR